MKNYYNQIRFLTTAALIFLVANPSKAANRQIDGVKLNSTNNGIELRLKTAEKSGNPSSFFTVSGDNSLEANLINTELKLPQGTNFHQENPFPGIAEIAVHQIDENNTQISISGEKGVAVKQSLQEKEGEIVLSLTPDAKTKQSSFQSTLTKLKSSFKDVIAQLPTQKDKVDSSSRNNNSGAQNSNILVPNPEIVISDKDKVDQDNIADNHLKPVRNNRRYLPRAVAPPVGDMAVSNIDASPEMINLGSSAIVPRLVLRDAPVREVLSLLARSAGLNLVFTDTGKVGEDEFSEEGNQEKTISLDLENEPVQEVFNSVLLVSGMNANRQRNTIYVGTELPAQARNLVSRTLRLNQVKAENAALFLASHGAEGQRLTTEVEEIRDEETDKVVQRTEKPAQLESLRDGLDEEDDSTSAALLKGLRVATDGRLNSITLIGEPRKVETATTFLTQLDARRRQVAVNVKVVDVNLLNQDDFNSSVSFGIGDTYFLRDNTSSLLNFGGENPTANGTLSRRPVGDETTIFEAIPEGGVREITIPSPSDLPDKFLALIEAQVTSGNAKILTDPTLTIQEGQQATVRLVQKIVESINTEIDGDSGTRTITPELGEAGLVLTVNVEGVDDNGFVSMSVSPSVSSIGATQVFDSGGAENVLNLLSTREISSGLVRIRDGQTLILSGIIQDQERTSVSKVPILGDIPLLGSLFRSTSKTNERAEVIVLLTPQVIDEQSELGSNYRPGKDAREMLQQRGFEPMPNDSKK